MNQVEITLSDIFWTLKRYFLWIVLVTIVFTVGAFCYTKFFITPKYSTSFCMGVNSNGRESLEEVSNNVLVAEERIAHTYEVLLTSQPVTNGVSEAMGGKVTAGKVKSMVTVEAKKNTMILVVTVTDTDPQRAADVANQISLVAPEILKELPVGGTLYSIETAKVPKNPVSPNMTSNLTIGILLGLLLSCSVVIMVAVLDTTIWREDDIARAFNVPVLGNVPCMDGGAGSKKSAKKKKRR